MGILMILHVMFIGVIGYILIHGLLGWSSTLIEVPPYNLPILSTKRD